jgi:hypothetical protein
MKYLKNFANINSNVKKVIYKKYKKSNPGYLEILFNDNIKIKIIPEGECCSISYIVKFKEFQFSKLVNKKIKSLTEITNNSKINKFFENVVPIDLDETNTYHLYEITYNNDDLFYFGLINSSNGYYDGWISIYEIK